MPRLLIFSDSHQQIGRMLAAAETHPEALRLVHLGDNERDAERLRNLLPDRQIFSCPGNCDFSAIPDQTGELIISGRRVVYTHGHLFGVKRGLTGLYQMGATRGADLLLFGHTHQPYAAYKDGMHIFNPGSISRPRTGKPSYGIADITAAGIVVNVIYV